MWGVGGHRQRPRRDILPFFIDFEMCKLFRDVPPADGRESADSWVARSLSYSAKFLYQKLNCPILIKEHPPPIKEVLSVTE